MTSYRTQFIENNIDGAALAELQEDMLREIGIQSLGHRLKILKSVRALLGQPDPRAAQTCADGSCAAAQATPAASELSSDAVRQERTGAPPAQSESPAAAAAPYDGVQAAEAMGSEGLPSGATAGKFSWQVSEWGRCSVTCGTDGVQTRAVSCHAPSGAQVPPIGRCMKSTQPPPLRPCDAVEFASCDAAPPKKSSVWCVWKRNRSCSLGGPNAQRLLSTELKAGSTRMDCQRLCQKFEQKGCCWFRYTPELPTFKCQFASGVLEHNDDFTGLGLDSAICK